jgi:hypothetical protein
MKKLISGVPGFVSYVAFRADPGEDWGPGPGAASGMTVTVCQDKAGADESMNLPDAPPTGSRRTSVHRSVGPRSRRGARSFSSEESESRGRLGRSSTPTFKKTILATLLARLSQPQGRTLRSKLYVRVIGAV